MTNNDIYLGSPMAGPRPGYDVETGTQKFWRDLLLHQLMSPDQNAPTGPNIQRTEGNTYMPLQAVPNTTDRAIIEDQNWNRIKWDPDVLNAAIQQSKTADALS